MGNLGSGGYGCVYLNAKHEPLGRLYNAITMTVWCASSENKQTLLVTRDLDSVRL